MGYYVNVEGDKKDWLVQNTLHPGTVRAPEIYPPEDKTLAYVCLVDNGPFTAAAVAYSRGEWEAFSDTMNDPRPRTWFTVPKEKLVSAARISPERFDY